ncbi:hypothetical protein GGH94_003107 [Coemansia aciculifera]|uniref:BZIP domain-containing protein n=1 Tax=Coemansia aciculifera TaxID=417176 RepID=A0A9W8IIG4_9FUNG|nr:hypothetical protein GGH94_003107 [Coemansia aciculifera]
MQPTKRQPQYPEYLVARLSTATPFQTAYTPKEDGVLAATAGSNSSAYPELEIDPSTMSPRSRRRYLSRMSSAKLRDRQRQHILGVEKDIVRLEARIESLQQSIDLHYMAQKDDDDLTDHAPSRNDKPASSLASVAVLAQNRIARTAEQFREIEPSTTIHSSSATKRRANADKIFYNLTMSLSGNMDRLTDCIKRIEMLKNDISHQVSRLERHVSQILPSPTLHGRHFSAGSYVFHKEYSSQNNTFAESSSASRRRIPISFLVNNS